MQEIGIIVAFVEGNWVARELGWRKIYFLCIHYCVLNFIVRAFST